YAYFTSFSDTMLQHGAALVERLIGERALGPKSLVVELASNDGYLLQYFVQAGIPVLGIEPAEHVARVAEEKGGVRKLSEFFGAALAGKLLEGDWAAGVMIANNVLAHVTDLHGRVERVEVL